MDAGKKRGRNLLSYAVDDIWKKKEHTHINTPERNNGKKKTEYIVKKSRRKISKNRLKK